MKASKITAAFLAAILAVCTTSCGKSDDSKDEKSSASKPAADTSSEETTEASSEENTEAGTEAETEAETEDASGEVSVNFETVDGSEYFTDAAPTPPVWKVTDPGSGNYLYLMGTIHVLPDGAFDKMPSYVMDIYENCDGIAVEYNTEELQSDMAQMQEFVQALMYQDGSTITDHISEESYEAAKNLLSSQGAYTQQYDMFQAGYWMSLLTSFVVNYTDGVSFDGVDANFIKLAQKDGKEVINIEELSAQTDALTGYTDELADALLMMNVEQMDDMPSYVETLGKMYNSWAIGDEEGLTEEQEEELEDIPEDLVDDYEQYNDTLLTKRNKQMAERASEFIKEGKNYFFMVGTLHYSGEEGVEDLLRSMGYEVERVEAATA